MKAGGKKKNELVLFLMLKIELETLFPLFSYIIFYYCSFLGLCKRGERTKYYNCCKYCCVVLYFTVLVLASEIQPQ